MKLIGSVLLVYLLALGAAAAQSAGEGRSFMVALPATALANRYSPPRARLLLASRTTSNVRVLYTATGATDAVTVAAGTVEEVLIDSARIMLPELTGRSMTTAQITSDAPITVMLLIDRTFAVESYTAIPDSLLGFEYLAVSSDETSDGDVIAVVGVSDNTRVTITPARPTRDGRPAGVPFVITLARGEVYQFFGESGPGTDMAGTSFVADKPCGVLSGAICTDITAGAEHSCNPLLEQLATTDSWGDDFVAGPLARQDLGYVRVVARCDGTVVNINGNPFATLAAGQTYEARLDTAYVITTSKPAEIAQFVTSTSRGPLDRSQAYGDPSMMLLPPTLQWSRSFQFFSPVLAARQDGGPPVGWRHFVQVAMARASEAGVRIDGAPPVWIRRMEVANRVLATAELGPGGHTLTAPDSIGATTYGYSAADAYAAPLGVMAFPYLLAAPPVATTTCGDTLDTVIVVTNVSRRTVVLESGSIIGDLDGTCDATRFPHTLAPTEQWSVPVRLFNVTRGRTRGYFVIWGGGTCRTRLTAVPIAVSSNAPATSLPSGTLIDFGVLPVAAPQPTRTFVMANRGATPLTIGTVGTGSADFVIDAPVFPVTLLPGDSIVVRIRFTRAVLGTSDGRAAFFVVGCTDTIAFGLHGVRLRSSELFSAALGTVQLLCPPKRDDTILVAVMNRGDVPLTISRGFIGGTDAGEFTLIEVLTSLTLAPGDSTAVHVAYRPNGLGARDARLVIESDAGNGSSIEAPLDVRNDTLLLAALPDTIDLGSSPSCSPLPVRRFAVINRSSYAITATGAFAQPAFGQVAFDNPNAAPNDTLWATATLTNNAEGLLTNSITVRVPDCNYSLSIPVRAVRLHVAAAFAFDTIDVGSLGYCGVALDSIVVFRNDGQVIDSLVLIHAPGPPFAFDAPTLPNLLQVNVSAALGVGLRAAAPGVYLDSMVILSEPCRLRHTLILRGTIDASRPLLSASTADFGHVTVGGNVRRTVMVVNHAIVPITLSPGTFAGDAGGVTLIRPMSGTVVAPGDSIAVELEYSPPSGADTVSGVLMLPITAPCSDTLQLTLAGFGDVERTQPILRWDDAAFRVGTEGMLRLMIDQSTASPLLDSLRLQVEMLFDKTLLLPLAVQGAGGIAAAITADRFTGDERSVTLELRGTFPTVGPLCELRALAMLGDADSTFLRFGSVDLVHAGSGAPVTVADTVAGVFRLEGVCREGGSRLLVAGAALRIAAVIPHPVSGSTTIAFETAEAGRVTMEVCDVAGARVATLVDDERAPGSYTVAFNASVLPAGLYWVRLRTAAEHSERAMIVLR